MTDIRDFLLEPASWQVDEAALRQIRNVVFVEEQGFTEDEEWDELDADASHILASTMQGVPIGTGRVTAVGRIGRIAVVQEWRGFGVGRALVSALEEAASSRGIKEVSLGAQVHATKFYGQLGYVLQGESYSEGGIEHRWMNKTLTRKIQIEKPRLEVQDRIVADLNSEDAVIDSQLQLSELYVEMFEATRRSVDIYTRDLEPRALDRRQIVAALVGLATSGRGRRIRILVEDTMPALDRGHRLIDLSQRLSTVVSIRVPAPVHRGYLGAYAIADARHVVQRDDASRPRASWLPNQPRTARRLLTHFDEVWEYALPEPHFQYLGL